ncbi:hypothetical protein Tco_0418572 [Tanacetum coccineum]
MMERVLANQKGRNAEVYLEEIVVKSKSEQTLVQYVEETLRKLRRMNIRIDPNESTFEVEEGKFLGSEPDMKPILKLTTISKFMPKLAELMHPIREVRKALDATNRFAWTSEAKKDF